MHFVAVLCAAAQAASIQSVSPAPVPKTSFFPECLARTDRYIKYFSTFTYYQTWDDWQWHNVYNDDSSYYEGFRVVNKKLWDNFLAEYPDQDDPHFVRTMHWLRDLPEDFDFSRWVWTNMSLGDLLCEMEFNGIDERYSESFLHWVFQP